MESCPTHQPEYLVSDLNWVICLTQGKISGVIKKTWKVLKEHHLAILCQECVAHCLHVLVKDILL